jgi:hypothetical protein
MDQPPFQEPIDVTRRTVAERGAEGIHFLAEIFEIGMALVARFFLQ